MNKIKVIIIVFLNTCSIMQASTLSSDNNEKSILNEGQVTLTNNWGAKLKSSNFHLGLDLQTKYMWRGMEMMTEESSPVVFPGINYQWKGLYAYAMGGYAINGKDDEYVGGKHNGHWLEACITYAPEKVPLWITISTLT